MQTKLIKKIAAITGITILALIIIVVMGIKIFGNNVIRKTIETVATNTLQVPVTLEKLKISPLAGAVELNDLVVANPEGYEHKNLLDAGKIKVNVNLASVTSDTIKIQDIIFDDIEVVVEQKGLTNNLKQILKTIEKQEKEETEEPEKPAKNLLINNLELNNIKVKVKLLPIGGKADTIPLNLAPIKMTDLGTDDKMSAAKLSGKILGAIALGIAQSGAGLLPDDMTKSLKNVMEGTSEVIKDAGKGIMEGGKDAVDGIGEGIKGIFKKK